MYEFLAVLIILTPFLAWWLAGWVLRRFATRRTP